MPGGPYPNQVGSVARYTTTTGGATGCDVVTCRPGNSELLAYIPDTAVNGSPMCWVLHGVGSDYIEIITSATFGANGCRDTLLDAGYIVISPSTPPPPDSQNSWGSQPGRDQHVAVWYWAQQIWPNVPGPYLYGISHGCIVGLNYLMEGLPVSAFMANSGVCSLAAGYNIAPGDVRDAYGLAPTGETPGTAGWLEKTAGHDPMVVALSAFPRVPMRFVASYLDNTAIQETNTDAFRARLDTIPWPVENSLYAYAGAHTASNSFVKADILAFFQRSNPISSSYVPGRLYTKQYGVAVLTAADLRLMTPTGLVAVGTSGAAPTITAS